MGLRQEFWNHEGAISKMTIKETPAAVQAFPLSAPTEARYVKIEATRLKEETKP